ncbi:MAG: DUF1573 domain-containing protein [Kiritimatiellae bacterium]|nr:DUF1573 domain-containing protein [Kiritimatiellia bacterium]MDW8457601.1 DUF1573 domain-containing protein [Verrucomicrobiota bacterium]
MNSIRLHFLLPTCLGAWMAIAAAQDAIPHRPKLVCDEPEYDFGTVDSSTVVDHTFTIRNEGTLTLEITRVHASCGCTVASISSQQIPPGGESKISARLSLQGRSGPQQKTILIESNDPDRPQFVLTMRGVAGSALNVAPQSILDPRVAPGSTPRGNVIISSGDGAEFAIRSVESTSEKLRASVQTLEDRKAYRIDVELAEPLESGSFSARLVVQTDHPKRPTVEIPVGFIVVREVIVAPREIVFDQEGSDPVSRFVLVRNADGSPVELDGIEPPDGSVMVTTQPFGANGIRVLLRNLVPSREMNGRVLRIHARHAAPIEVPIRVQGAGS